MANTTNLNLEELSINDNLKTTFINKLNNNQTKIDNAYGQLKQSLLDSTGETTLVGAIEEYNNEFQNIVGQYTSVGDASESDIMLGKTALVQGVEVVGTYEPPEPLSITCTVTGSYASSISDYGAGINDNGKLCIYASSNTSTYEHIYFNATSIVGTKGSGWDITSFDSSGPINVLHACTINGLLQYKNITVTLNCSNRNSTYDYIQVDVTVTAH